MRGGQQNKEGRRTFSFLPHWASEGHRKVHPGRSGISTAPLRLWRDNRHFTNTTNMGTVP